MDYPKFFLPSNLNCDMKDFGKLVFVPNTPLIYSWDACQARTEHPGQAGVEQ